MDATLRPFAPGDQAGLRRLVLDGLGDHVGTIDETLNPDLDDIAGWYRPLGGEIVVAELGGRIVAGGILHREDERTGRLVRVTVDRRLRGRGLGRRLVEHLVDLARRRGYAAVVCETTDSWQDAIALYLRCGFREEARRDGDIHLRLLISDGMSDPPPTSTVRDDR